MASKPAVVLPPPKAPSALIRGARWVAFLSGLVYGMKRYRYVKAKEEAFQEQQAPLIVKRAERLKREKIAQDKADMIYLYREANGRDPPAF